MRNDPVPDMDPDSDLEPMVESPVISDRDARPARRATVCRCSFAVAGQPAEGARPPFDYIAREAAAMMTMMVVLL